MIIGEANLMKTHEQIIEELWSIIDDIDTLDDMCRDNDSMFRNYVRKSIQKRWETGVTTDGYNLKIPHSHPK